MPCWRQCGSTVANHYHVFWDCLKLNVFWKGIQTLLSTVFNTLIPLSFDALYLGLVPFLERRREIKLLQSLLVASKKTITRRWLNPIQSTLDDWIGITPEIYGKTDLSIKNSAEQVLPNSEQLDFIHIPHQSRLYLVSLVILFCNLLI